MTATLVSGVIYTCAACAGASDGLPVLSANLGLVVIWPIVLGVAVALTVGWLVEWLMREVL